MVHVFIILDMNGRFPKLSSKDRDGPLQYCLAIVIDHVIRDDERENDIGSLLSHWSDCETQINLNA